MTALVIECLIAALSEIVGIAVVAALIRVLTDRGLNAFGEAAGRRLLFRLLRSFGTRIIPVLGFAWIVFLVYQAINGCF
jgi:hypothetical protein